MTSTTTADASMERPCAKCATPTDCWKHGCAADRVIGRAFAPALDATRYARLRALGVAPMDTLQLEHGTVLRFQNLDDFVDADLRARPSRGEAAPKEAAEAMREDAKEVLYEHHSEPHGTTFKQYESDPVPKWAVNVRRAPRTEAAAVAPDADYVLVPRSTWKWVIDHSDAETRHTLTSVVPYPHDPAAPSNVREQVLEEAAVLLEVNLPTEHLLMGEWTKGAIHAARKGAKAIRALKSATPDAGKDNLSAKYDELLYAVSMKHRGESRHETALRYIKQAEQPRGFENAKASDDVGKESKMSDKKMPLPPQHEGKHANFHWLEYRDFDGRNIYGMKPVQWNPVKQKWYDAGLFNEVNVDGWVYIALCPMPEQP